MTTTQLTKFWIGRLSDQIQGNYSAWAIYCGGAETIEEARKLKEQIEQEFPCNRGEGYYIFNEAGEIQS